MSTEQATAEKPKRKTKPRKRRPAPARAAATPRAPKPEPVDEFAGLTAHTCCTACGPRCVITATGSGTCGHPGTTGLQRADALRPDVVATYARAKKKLAIARLK
jgi:hypothetical protein